MKQQKSIIVKGKYNGLRLDQFLSEVYYPWISHQPDRKKIQELIVTGMIQVNGREARPSYRIQPGETVMILAESVEMPPEKTRVDTLAIPVLFEDRNILAINKPAGLSLHPSRSGQRGTLVDWIEAKYPRLKKVGENPLRPGIVHRLDKETSGLVLLAKNNTSFQALKKLFQERKIEKTYTALVYGRMKEKKGLIDVPIGRIGKSHLRGVPLKKRVFSGSLRPSLTEYELCTSYPQYSFLSIKPKTGRTHQIRVHMASIGHPIVGDEFYRFKTHRKDGLNPAHQLLHAEKLRFELLGQKYDFTAPLPDYFARALRSLDERG